MQNQKAFDNFDEFAKDYRQIHNENIKATGADSDYFSEYKVIEIARVKEPNLKSGNVLDLGCGDGNSARFFQKHLPAFKVNGIDISEDSILEAKARNLPNANFEPYDGKHIPFEENKFDIVLIATVMHHIRPEHQLDLMKEVLRVTKPKGKVYIFEHNPWNPVTQHIVNTCVFDKDAILLTPPYCKNLVKQAGFKDVNNSFTLFFPRSTMFKPLLSIEKYLSFIPMGGQYYTTGTK